MREIRVALDATPLLLRSAGVKTYVYYWAEALRRSAGRNRLDLFPFLGRVEGCVHERSVAGPLRTYGSLAAVHAANVFGHRVLEWAGRRADVFHASHQLFNPPRNTRLTATIYDMTCWLMPELHPGGNVSGAKRFAERVMRRADALIAISRNTRDDAIRILGLDPEKVHVIYPGVAPAFFDARPRPRAKPYILSVGTVEPRKNLGVLLDAYGLLPEELRHGFDLLVAGSPGWGEPGTLARLRAGLPGVRYLGYVAEDDLPALTAGASVFAYLSLYEGFGLPVAQAMAAGVPAVISNLSCLPEIAGPGAVAVDPHSPIAISGVLRRLLENAVLRKELAETGRRKAEGYRWERCADESWRLFESIA